MSTQVALRDTVAGDRPQCQCDNAIRPLAGRVLVRSRFAPAGYQASAIKRLLSYRVAVSSACHRCGAEG